MKNELDRLKSVALMLRTFLPFYNEQLQHDEIDRPSRQRPVAGRIPSLRRLCGRRRGMRRSINFQPRGMTRNCSRAWDWQVPRQPPAPAERQPRDRQAPDLRVVPWSARQSRLRRRGSGRKRKMRAWPSSCRNLRTPLRQVQGAARRAALAHRRKEDKRKR